MHREQESSIVINIDISCYLSLIDIKNHLKGTKTEKDCQLKVHTYTNPHTEENQPKLVTV